MKTRIGLVVLAVLLLFESFVVTASAESLSFRFRSDYSKIVDVELYSDTRRGHVWPGKNRIYVLDDYSVKTISISCQYGEKICYGAWVRNRDRTYWGVGHDNQNSCKGCCYTCDGGQTRIIRLTP